MIRITTQNIIKWWSPVCLCIIATIMTHLIIKCVQVFEISLFLQKKKKKNHLNNNNSRNNDIVGDGSSYFHLKKMVCRCVCVCVKVGFDLSFFSISWKKHFSFFFKKSPSSHFKCRSIYKYITKNEKGWPTSQ